VASSLADLDLWPAGCGQVIVIDPDTAMHMTVTKNHPKHEAEGWFIDPLIGVDNIVTSEGNLWKYLHKMLSPAFAVQHITNMRPDIAEEIMEFRSILHRMAESGQKFSLEEITLRTTFDVIGKATFGHSMNAKSNGSKALEHWDIMTRAFAKTRESWNPVRNFLSKRIVQRETKQLDQILADLIRKRFDVVVQEKTDLSNKKGLGIMDLILRDYVEDIRQSGKQGLDPAFLKTAVTQVKTLVIAGNGKTAHIRTDC
jgi:cytochrome P450